MTGLTKIISGLRSVSTLHQLLMNTFILFELSISRLINHVLLCIIERPLPFKLIITCYADIPELFFHLNLFHLMYLLIGLCCSWNKLLVRLAGGELAPRLSLVSPKVFSPFCHRWSFGSLPPSPLACLFGDTSFPAISST